MGKHNDLNRKLAEWAGLCWHECKAAWEDWGGEDVQVCVKCNKVNPTNIDFTSSLDACFKWLYPELRRRYLQSDVWRMLRKWVESMILGGEEPAPAFCKAIEKLIDEEQLKERE